MLKDLFDFCGYLVMMLLAGVSIALFIGSIIAGIMLVPALLVWFIFF